MTWQSGDLPKEGDERLLHQSQTGLKPHNLIVSALNISNNELTAPADQELANDDAPANDGDDTPANNSDNTPADDDQAPADVSNDIDIQNLVNESYK